MRWLGAWGAVLSCALVAASCTSAPDEAVTTTSLSLSAPQAVVQVDDILRYGISSTPSDPWVHYRTSCDTSCGLVFGALTNTLFASALDGATVGLLVERHEANSDNTVHTWRLRDGIRFSDNSLLDAEAVKLNIDACRHSALTGPGLAGIDDVRAEGLTLTITTLAPWGNLPVHFAETPCGHMFSAPWLRSLPDLPMRMEGAPFFDQELAESAPTGDPTSPVGLGAFVMTAFAPGNGNSTLLERNVSYWRGPGGTTGESFVGAEQVELVVIGDDAIRRAALEAGQLDVAHTHDPQEADQLQALGASVRSEAFSDEVLLAYNAFEAPDNPLQLVSCRRAVDRALDRDAIAEALGQPTSSGPFQIPGAGDEPGSGDGFVDEMLPFDAGPASQWAARCTDDWGLDADEDGVFDGVSLELIAAADDERAVLLASMIEASINAGSEVPGLVTIDVVEVEAPELALAVLLGDYDIALWEGFGGVHPDLHFRWWFSEAASPVGTMATNVSRIDDPALDRALVELRRADDFIESQRAVEAASAAFGSGSWSSWLTRVEWTIGFGELVSFDLSRTTPEGVPLVPMVNGVHDLLGIVEGGSTGT